MLHLDALVCAPVHELLLHRLLFPLLLQLLLHCCLAVPATAMILISSQDRWVHYYDLRNTALPLFVMRDHKKAVSYVQFLSRGELVSSYVFPMLVIRALTYSVERSLTMIQVYR